MDPTYSIQGLLAGSPMGAWTVRFPGLFMPHPDITAYIISAGTSLSHSAPAPPFSMVFFAFGSQNPSENEVRNVREYHAFLAFPPSALALRLHPWLHLRLHTGESLGLRTAQPKDMF